MQTIQSSIVRGVIGLLVVTYVFVVASARAAGADTIWHIKAVHPEGRLLDVKAIDKQGNIYDVKAIEVHGNRHLLDIKAMVGGKRIPVKVLVSEDKLEPVKAILDDGTILDIKALTSDGKRLDVKGVQRSGTIIDIKAIGPEGSRVDVRVVPPGVVVVIDVQRVEQILRNLVDNALKFSAPDARVSFVVASGLSRLTLHPLEDPGQGDARPLDAGHLSNATPVEAMTAVLLHLNRRYRTRAALRITGIPPD